MFYVIRNLVRRAGSAPSVVKPGVIRIFLKGFFFFYPSSFFPFLHSFFFLSFKLATTLFLIPNKKRVSVPGDALLICPQNYVTADVWRTAAVMWLRVIFSICRNYYQTGKFSVWRYRPSAVWCFWTAVAFSPRALAYPRRSRRHTDCHALF